MKRKEVSFGVDLTINYDDILIFDSDISKEYMRLYNAVKDVMKIFIHLKNVCNNFHIYDMITSD